MNRGNARQFDFRAARSDLPGLVCGMEIVRVAVMTAILLEPD